MLCDQKFGRVRQALKDYVDKHNIPVFSSELPLEQQDDHFKDNRLSLRDHYLWTLESALLVQYGCES